MTIKQLHFKVKRIIKLHTSATIVTLRNISKLFFESVTIVTKAISLNYAFNEV